ncbi:Serine/threonine-protein kinase [Yamadazyma tenuis]|uniref:Serine/threonine-protein kinase ATG1 n=1 Tax=Candida tenuis (strain ATCC 10573 / BCRC 21748 / CBS 615 / JCM 9827 / NBRC 10315 / NRRL Y-1498 / VKM Y-70) TaxID=590646 RepID=G3B4K2_CANTC|nr:Pkinase-domain-containing protein [Yamadazyma tenuis ATCC 10573]EGV63966.1 Pkinase-domain-containing protein [Yamadazyma tenuis ATCC 10573]WEJ96418.1 Serine/threonine-protein kinase [Yamadazyma tenuis]
MSASVISTDSRRSTGQPERIGNYQLGKEIGKGSFATVYKCINLKTNQAVAIKSVVRSKLKSKKLLENLEIEISILKSMKHPHIVGLLDYEQSSSHFHLVMDYCSMGDLSYFIRKRNQLIKTHPVISSLLDRYPSPEGSHGLNQVLVIHFLKQLSSALSFLRDKSLVHRDIKPQNLLLCPPSHSKEDFEANHFVGLWELPILKIADFGFARFLPSTSMAETLCGSPLYMAPEILRYEKYNAKADLWSVGAVLYEMTVGKPPFKAANHIELLKNIEKSNDRIKFPSSSKVPDSLKKLVRSLLKYNPTERISFNEFFNDQLIVDELDSVDKPLETSQLDENLFISEYISPIPKITNKIEPLTKLSSHEDKVNPHELRNTTASSKENRDEEIKKIINKNSPGPEPMSESMRRNAGSNKFHDSLIKNDSALLEKDYVVVEKRAVEVNAIADELAQAGSGAVAIRRSSSTSSGGSGENNSLKYASPHFKKYSTRSNSGTSQRRPSLSDRRISISISPSNALSKAIGLASNRLFGYNNQISEEANRKILLDGAASGFGESSAFFTSPNFTNQLLSHKFNLPTSSSLQAQGQGISQIQSLSADEVVLLRLESLATKAHAINLFADVKFTQLIPSPPSNDDDLDDDLLHQNDILPPKMIKTISEEGVVLYVKTLSLLAKGMTIASEWWYSQVEVERSNSDSQINTRSHGSSPSPTPSLNSNINISVRINELVQWIREKFNESLEKAEFIKLRLQEVDSILESESGEQGSDSNLTSMVSNLSVSGNKAVAEKLIFDRALEMSRNAAVNELVKEDLKGCELAYSTAIWMLEALLDDDLESSNKLDTEDKQMIEKFVVSIGNRLSVLKRKLDFAGN